MSTCAFPDIIPSARCPASRQVQRRAHVHALCFSAHIHQYAQARLNISARALFLLNQSSSSVFSSYFFSQAVKHGLGARFSVFVSSRPSRGEPRV